VLDVGCGEGQVARHLAALGIDVIGLDPTSSQVRVARERAGGPQFARARAEALPWRDGGFDAVLLCLALEHVDEFEAAIDGVARVLEPGGRFVLVSPCCRRRKRMDRRPDRRSATGDRAYLDHEVVDEVAPGVDLRFIPTIDRYVRLGPGGPAHRRHGGTHATRFVADTWGYRSRHHSARPPRSARQV
jgi:SAM-dependent methyltransferase